jgi:leucine-rich repeat-containing protein 49
MSSTKTRGRPNATQIIDTSTSPLISNISTTISAQQSAFQQQFVPSLLRIESVVPTRLNVNRFQRVNRLFTRSYSTLCGNSSIPNPFTLISSNLPVTSSTSGIAAATTITTTNNNNVNYKNVTKKINTNLQRHKNHHYQQRLEQNGHESPSSKINNHQTTTETSCCIIAENGIQKVRRTPKEKDKQPDRINLDRRGLCQIPIIDNEPGLRLLSLQHNLINTFHVPENNNSNEASIACNNVNNEDGVKDNNNNNLTLLKDDSNKSTTTSTTATTTSEMAIINNNKPTQITTAKPFLKQKSISRNQLNLNFSANNNNNNNNNTSTSSTTIAMTSTNSNAFLQKQFIFSPSTGVKHGVLKRANSVMINYTPSPPTPTSSSSPLAIAALTTTQTMLNGGNGSTTILAQRNKLVATPSFSHVIDTGTHHEMVAAKNFTTTSNSPDIQIDANNSYLNSFRFNLTNLVFLDLYNNQIEKISNLDGLKSLTVLLLGKNRITDISGIVSVRFTLRVLDLHGNRITSIAKICQLQELKSLNLAGNQLKQIQPGDFSGLQHLKELNLKRNRIKKINVSDDLHNLER